jgi:hypothetical protein
MPMQRFLVALATAALATVSFATVSLAQDSPKPIRFARGATSAAIEGAVVRGARDLYTLDARGGQAAQFRISSAERNAVFQIYAPGAVHSVRDGIHEVEGTALPGAGEADDATTWSGRLPASGTYLIVVGGTRGNASYRLGVTVR